MRKIGINRRKLRKRRFSRMNFVLSVLLITACGISAWVYYEVLYSEAAEDWFETATVDNVTVSLPEDDGSHQVAMESWHFNGHLKSESGDFYSFYHTVFVVNNLVSHTISHVSLNDHQTGKHFTAQRKTVGNSSISKENRFEFIQDDWLMAGGNGDDRLKVSTEDFSFDLSAVATRAPMFHGDNGIITLDIASDSYYYTRARMAISGIIIIGETIEKVTGISWFDHQWGDFSVGILSKDWLGLQLNDGSDVMIYQLRDKYNRSISYTGSISQNGITETLLETDFTFVAGETWTSSNSNITYPIAWAIDIPKKNINITIQSINKNNEFDATLTSYNIYWKGPVKVQGSHTGLGFMELNYMDKKS
jgi:predicted secreted hydrolase